MALTLIVVDPIEDGWARCVRGLRDPVATVAAMVAEGIRSRGRTRISNKGSRPASRRERRRYRVRRFVVDEEGKWTAIVLSKEEYERMLEALEDMEALREADEALEVLRRGEEDPLPLEEAIREIEEEHRS